MIPFLILSAATFITGAMFFQYKEKQHRKRMDSLDVNIHVNGIRGKSTVTRLIGGVLRESGHKTIAKTTGTYACVIDNEANEHPIKRTGPANINEQYRFLEQWLDADSNNGTTAPVRALAVECMAVKPKYQALCQNVILRSPITVLTNVRLDHQEELGESLEEIASSLCSTVPKNGTLITGERDPKIVDVIQQHCAEQETRLIVAQETERSRELCSRFSYRQFEENVAIVFAVAKELGIPMDVAERGMLSAEPDPGTVRITQIQNMQGGPLYWVPMFAINDLESTIRVFHDIADDLPPCKKIIALNNRADRTDRAALFVDIVATHLLSSIDRVVLYGEIQEVVQQKLITAGVPEDMIATTADLNGPHGIDGKDLVSRSQSGFHGDPVAIFGMVNIHTDYAVAMERYIKALSEGQTMVSH